jgi:uncharacterized membrane protein YdjX (TVP38/TMEM64 family)
VAESVGRTWVKIALITAVFLGVAVAVAVFIGPRQAEIVEFVEEFGILAPLAGAVAYAVLSVLLIPGSLLSLAAGYVFGALVGTAVAVIGGIVGATASFAISRTVARGPVRRLTSDRRERFDRWLERHGAMAFAYVRVIPGVPYQVVNYVAGVTGVSTQHYVIGSALGLVPGAVVYAALGGTLHDPTSPEFIAAVLLLIVVLTAGPFVQRRLDPEGEDRPGG